MGSGSWDTRSFVSYSTSKGYGTDSRGVVTGSYSNQEMFKAKNIDAALDPKGVIRECCDNEEHPNTFTSHFSFGCHRIYGTDRSRNCKKT